MNGKNGNGSRLEYVKVAILGLAVALILGFVIPKLNALDYSTQALQHKLNRVDHRVTVTRQRQIRLERANAHNERRVKKTTSALTLILQTIRNFSEEQGLTIVMAEHPPSESGRDNRSHREGNPPKDKPTPDPRPHPIVTCLPVVKVCI